ncbi:hypothetical protein ACEXQD_09080 [Herbiconiux sp. P15]|uniref:hypothetical protein n=1 Tax=Herbiconiux liukaitaii TaxID=3342799 RepID=UPI0035B82C05
MTLDPDHRDAIRALVLENSRTARPERSARLRVAATASAAVVVVAIAAAAVTVAGLGLTGAPLAADPSPTSSAASGPQTEGEPAVWFLADPSSVNPDSTSLDVDVTRMACSSGVTGDTLEPVVTYTEASVVIRIDVAPLALGDATCVGNESVPVVVELSEPLGDRTLIDGSCDRPGARGTSLCLTAERYPVGSDAPAEDPLPSSPSSPPAVDDTLLTAQSAYDICAAAADPWDSGVSTPEGDLPPAPTISIAPIDESEVDQYVEGVWTVVIPVVRDRPDGPEDGIKVCTVEGTIDAPTVAVTDAQA